MNNTTSIGTNSVLFSTRTARWATAATIALAVVTATSAASAQVSEQFTLERFRISTDREGILDIEWGETLGHLDWDLGLWLGTSDDPLVVVERMDTGDQRISALVGHRMGGQLVAGLGVSSWLQAGLEVPVILTQSQEATMTPFGMGGGLESAGLGDIRLIPKFQLLRGHRHGVDLAVIPALTIPTSTSEDFFGESGLTFVPELAVSRSFGPLRLASNLGYRVRGGASLADLSVDDEVFWRIGAGYRLGDAGGPPVEFDLTLASAAAADEFMQRSNNNHMELLGATQYQFNNRVQGFIAGGVGIAQGFGTPDWRALVGVRVGRIRSDRFASRLDTTPPAGAVQVEKEYTDDNTGKTDDAAPVPPRVAAVDCDRLELERTIEFADDGATLSAASLVQLDAVAAFLSAERPALRIAVEAPAGRADAVVDYLVGRGVAAERLAPIAVADSATPVRFRIAAGGACKKAAPCQEINLDDKINFETASAVIDAESLARLKRDVVWVLADHTDIHLSIEGHTDNVGRRTYNQRLSEARAAAVRDYLVSQGIAAARVRSAGYGMDRPVADNATAAGRADNRRIELRITKGGSCAPCNKIEVKQRILFETDKAEIKRESHGELDRVVSILEGEPKLSIAIEGHTDDVGRDDYNLGLSQRRAKAVKSYMVDRGLGEKRLSAEGFGETRPLVKGTSDAARATNRRVEFRLTSDTDCPKAR